MGGVGGGGEGGAVSLDGRQSLTSMPYRPAMPAFRTAEAMTLHAV
jgi:hypothetical protein